MATSVALIWYLVIAGPQGGMVALPSTFDKREQCTAAISEYQKQPQPAGWTLPVRAQRLAICRQWVGRIERSPPPHLRSDGPSPQPHICQCNRGANSIDPLWARQPRCEIDRANFLT